MKFSSFGISAILYLAFTLTGVHAAPKPDIEPASIVEARRIVAKAQALAALINKRYIDTAHLRSTDNNVKSYHSINQRSLGMGHGMEMDLLHRKEVRDAAAVVAEYEARGKGEVTVEKRQDTSYWMESMVHGKSAFGPADYKVWRNVKDYGAKGDGATDDTAAINAAIADQNRCGKECGSSTTLPAIIYFPAGTYLISSSVKMYYNTQLIGNPNSRPTLKAAGSFIGLGVITTNPYIDGGNGAQWYIPQSNFFRQIRNFVVDITGAPLGSYAAGIHWQIAQATSLQNIEFRQSKAPGTTHQGIFMESGSGGMFYDLVFDGGAHGMYCGNQQFTTRNLKFVDTATAIRVHWDWGWTFKSLDIQNAGVGVALVGSPGSRVSGSVIFMYSSIRNTKTAVLVPEIINAPGKNNTASLIIDNVKLTNVDVGVQVDQGVVLVPGGSKTIKSWGIGKVYSSLSGAGSFLSGGNITPQRAISGGLLGGMNGGFFERSRPQYADIPASGFTNVQTFGAKGDGQTDDTEAINSALKKTAGKSILYFPFGTYIVTDTIFVPEGSKITGEIWPQIMASGCKFSKMNHPRAVMQVGKEGDSGVVEITDMLITVRGATAGAVLMEWNIKQDAAGSAAMWDTHFRVGGAVGTSLRSTDCPKLTGSVNPKCIAASMLLHLTEHSSAYLENVWAWVADHDLDIPAQTQIDIYAGRGILIESKHPTWLYGTASEHCVLYQYQLSSAKDVFMGMIQTETPYFQRNPPAPEPFTSSLGEFTDDPKFHHCDAGSLTCALASGLRIVESSNVYIYGAGLYSFFNGYVQDCIHTNGEVGSCQDRMVETFGGAGVWLFNLITKSAIQQITPEDGRPVPATENKYGFGSTIMGYLALSG